MGPQSTPRNTSRGFTKKMDLCYQTIMQCSPLLGKWGRGPFGLTNGMFFRDHQALDSTMCGALCFYCHSATLMCAAKYFMPYNTTGMQSISTELKSTTTVIWSSQDSCAESCGIAAPTKAISTNQSLISRLQVCGKRQFTWMPVVKYHTPRCLPC